MTTASAVRYYCKLYIQSERGAHEFGVFSRARRVRVPDQFLLPRGGGGAGDRATVVVVMAVAVCLSEKEVVRWFWL